MVEECRRSSIPGGNCVYEKFDDDDQQQLMSMFNNVASDGPNNNICCTNSSSPSDQNNMNDDDDDFKLAIPMKSEPEEDQNSGKSEGHNAYMEISKDKIVDPKKIKRILANRQSAQRCRVRKLQYISELERVVTSLQAEVTVLSPRVAFLDHQRLVLGVDNSVLKQRIAALGQDKIFKDAHQEALKREIERLRRVYYKQNMKNIENASPTDSKQQPSPAMNGSAEKEQLVI